MDDIAVGAGDLVSLPDEDWFARIKEFGRESGYFRWLGRHHAALFVKAGPTLLVTFETEESIRRRKTDQLPLGYSVAKDRGHSHLCIIARTETWYRDQAVYDYFDELVDSDFFDTFDHVVFYGAGMCGYAAAAYSVCSPGATVILIQPQATLDARVAGWDPRYPEMRRTNFTKRYGFAPDMTDGAADVYVIYDPEQNLDAMHAALFSRPHVTLLPCRNLGRDIKGALDHMQILPSVLAAACSRSFDSRLFHIFYRARRNDLDYLGSLLARLEHDGRAYLGAMLCRNVVSRKDAPRFKARLEQLEAGLQVVGRRLPPKPT